MLIFIIYSIKNITQRPRIVPLKIMPKTEAVRRDEAKLKDLRLIYEENDLFGTYRQAFVPEKIAETIPSLPKPPAPKPIIRQQPAPIQFLEPLPIKITGIIASSSEAKSQVSIMNNNTKKTDSYRVGDKLFDAYIIRIFPRKVIIIRSNGQQETLFLFPSDAHLEIKNLEEPAWHEIIQRQGEFTYLVNPYEFASRVTSLAAFIEMVDLTTAFKNGQSVGLRVGKMEQKSIGYALGFLPGDTIIKIQNIDPTTTKSRLDIYNKLTQMNVGELIKVHVMRHGHVITYEYTLHNLSEPDVLNAPLSIPSVQENFPLLPISAQGETEQIRRAVIENHPENLRPAKSDDWHVREMKKRDKQAMQNYGSRASSLATAH